MLSIATLAKAQAIALIIACILDLILGDPNFPLHPVRMMGGLIWLFEKIMRAIFLKNKGGEIIGGFFMAVFVIAICGGLPLLALYYSYSFDLILGIAVEAVLCYFMLSGKSLARSARRVFDALMRGDIKAARKLVSMIVGRDTDNLDDIGVTKAAVESVAENTNDGIVAPLIYMAIGGAVLGCVYKSINTMDSMVGYKNEKYINFGKFAARLDDVFNFIPSRIAAYIMIISAYFIGLDGGRASLIHKRDCRKHDSPNSAQTESVAAGALRIQLGGDAYYGGVLHKRQLIGDAIKDIQYGNILRVNRLMYMTYFLTAVIFIALKFAVSHWL